MKYNKLTLILVIAFVIRIFFDSIVLCDENWQRTIYPASEVLNRKSIQLYDVGEMRRVNKGWVFVRK